jgi:hypothetical protein
VATPPPHFGRDGGAKFVSPQHDRGLVVVAAAAAGQNSANVPEAQALFLRDSRGPSCKTML